MVLGKFYASEFNATDTNSTNSTTRAIKKLQAAQKNQGSGSGNGYFDAVDTADAPLWAYSGDDKRVVGKPAGK